MGDFPLTGTGLEAGGVPMGIGPRRAALDAILIDAAVEAGAEFREGHAVRELRFDGERVTGIEGERAKLVIGADGRNSHVAKLLAVPVTYEKPAISIMNFGAAHLMAPPDLLAMRQTLRGDQEATNAFYRRREGIPAA